MRKIILTLILLISSLISVSYISSQSVSNEQLLVDNGKIINWDLEDTPYYVFEYIFVGEILEIVEVYQKNDDDVHSTRNIPITHYKVKVFRSLKGEIKESIIDLFFYGGYDENGLILYEYANELPLVGKTYVIFSSQPSEKMIDVDSRLSDGVFQNWGRPQTIIELTNFNPEINIYKQDKLITNELKKILSLIEKNK